jgi:hypothetical protein
MKKEEVKKDIKKAKKVVKEEIEKPQSTAKETFVRGTLGIVLLLVFGSIATMTVTVVGGLEGNLRYIMVAPAAAFDAFIAFLAFSKILK